VLVLAPSLSGAQTRVQRANTAPNDDAAGELARRPDVVRDHFGAPAAERLLASDRADDRLRGVERLAAAGDARSIERLIRAFEQGTPLAAMQEPA